MKKILIALMLIMPFFASAQEDSILVFKDSLSTYRDSLLVRNLVDSLMEDGLKKEQITSISGISFGISQEKALPILRNKYGREDVVY